jgi:CRP-like cAMP-binding protein
MPKDFKRLCRCQLFSELPDEHLDLLASRVQQREYSANSIVFEQGDPGNTLFVVEYGEVVIGTMSPTGKELIVATLGPGDSFGELALIDGARRSASARTTLLTGMLVIYRDDFFEVLDSRPEVKDAVLVSLASVIRRMNIQLAEVAMLGSPSRVARVFLDLAEEHGEEVPEGILIRRSVPVGEIAGRAKMYDGEVEHLLIDFQYSSLIQRVDDQYMILRMREMENLAHGRLLRTAGAAAEDL